jgi:hypothetical protein
MKVFLLKLRGKVRRTDKPWSVRSRISDFILTYLISFGAGRKIRAAYSNYLNGGVSVSNTDELVIASNFLSKGRQRNRLVSGARFELDISDFDQLNSVLPEFDIDACVKELQQNGFTKLPVSLPSEFVAELIELASNSEVMPTKFAKIQGFQSAPNSEIDHIWDVPFENSIRSAACQSLIQDRQLLILAGKYLQANPVIIGSRLYWSLAHENEEFLTAENWHVDSGDGLRFVKLFVALTHVSTSNGPTGYIKGSHKSLPRKFYSGRRFHPKEIERRFSGQLLEATGPVGTIYLADTRGLHRGTPVREGKRLLLHFFYGTDFFGFARPTTVNLGSEVCFGDNYRGILKRTFAAFSSSAPSNTAKMTGP